jgi:hypothetical protein
MVQGYSGTGSVSGPTTTPGASGRSSKVRIGRPSLAFEAGDVAAEGLLGQVQPGGGTGEVQLLGDGHEMAQQAQVELVRHVPGTSARPIDTLAR